MDKISAIKAQDSNANTAPLESKLDDLVYALYELDLHEIKIIESNLQT